MSVSDAKTLDRVSRMLSFVLRHAPESVGLNLDAQGWAEIDALVKALNRRPDNAPKRLRTLPVIARELIEEVVSGSDKQRFALSADGKRIRAVQGHSIEVNLGYERTEPPPVLYHGTHAGAVEGIRKEGLRRGDRHDVHLSADMPTAVKVGGRRGSPVVLEVLAGEMHAAGYRFSVAPNGTWLVAEVPVRYVRFSGRPTDD